MKKMIKIWLESTGFEKNNDKQKAELITFALLGSLTIALCWTWLVFPLGIATMVSYKKCVKDNCHVDE